LPGIRAAYELTIRFLVVEVRVGSEECVRNNGTNTEKDSPSGQLILLQEDSPAIVGIGQKWRTDGGVVQGVDNCMVNQISDGLHFKGGSRLPSTLNWSECHRPRNYIPPLRKHSDNNRPS
jgi:hypothetical protein